MKSSLYSRWMNQQRMANSNEQDHAGQTDTHLQQKNAELDLEMNPSESSDLQSKDVTANLARQCQSNESDQETVSQETIHETDIEQLQKRVESYFQNEAPPSDSTAKQFSKVETQPVGKKIKQPVVKPSQPVYLLQTHELVYHPNEQVLTTPCQGHVSSVQGLATSVEPCQTCLLVPNTPELIPIHEDTERDVVPGTDMV